MAKLSFEEYFLIILKNEIDYYIKLPVFPDYTKILLKIDEIKIRNLKPENKLLFRNDILYVVNYLHE